MPKTALFKRPAGETKRFAVAISLEAHKKLRTGADAFGIGQDYVLSVLLEQVDWSDYAEAIEAFKESAVAAKAQRVKPDEVKAYLATLSPAERAALLKDDTNG